MAAAAVRASSAPSAGLMPPALPRLPAGTWAGNSISENLNYRHFINVTHLVTVIPEDKPTEEELFGPYWARYGK